MTPSLFDPFRRQLVYNNHPLYRYSGDSAEGQANGQGSAGIWFVMDP